MSRYNAPEEVNSEAKVAFFIFAKDFLFIIFFMTFSFLFSKMLAEVFILPFMVYSLVVAILLTVPSPFNKKRRMYQSILMFIKKDDDTYRAI